jgi:serine/threonine protein kinase
MSLSTGTQLGPYVILAPIGAGGMGKVYKARDTRRDRIVAIKVAQQVLSGLVVDNEKPLPRVAAQLAHSTFLHSLALLVRIVL